MPQTCGLDPGIHIAFEVKSRLGKRRLINKVSKYNQNSNLDMISRAYDFCVEAHKGQVRASGEEYSSHPIAVANMAADMQLDDATIITALLHDVVEDTKVTAEEIRAHFSEEIANLVEGVTKLERIKFKLDHIKESENFRKLFIALSKDVRVIVVKLCDRLHNMQTINSLAPPKQRRIAIETLEVYAPLAERLGMYEIKNELQDLSFKILNPIARESIVKRLKSLKLKYNRATKSKDILKTIETLFGSIMQEKGIRAEVYGREKKAYSIWTKINAKKISFDKLADVMAFRLICESVDDCYKALGVIHQKYHAVPNVFVDYISTPKENGYMSIHTIIFGPFNQKIEIQIRTKEMDINAEYGLASHWSYKQKAHDDKQTIRTACWIKRVLEIIHESNDPNELMEAAKLEMYGEQIFAFTPDGKMLNLPQNSTVLDFAFMLDSSLGAHCVNANIDGKIVPSGYKIQNGDVVEIIKSKKISVRLEDLENCITSKAKRIISHLTRDEKNRIIKAQGQKTVEKTMQIADIPVTPGNMEKMLSASGLDDFDAFFSNVAKGILSPSSVIRVAFPGRIERVTRKEDFFAEKKIFNPAVTTKSMDLKMKGLISGISPDMEIKFATCCDPGFRQPIVAHLMEEYPLFIHHKNCEALESMNIKEGHIFRLSWKKS